VEIKRHEQTVRGAKEQFIGYMEAMVQKNVLGGPPVVDHFRGALIIGNRVQLVELWSAVAEDIQWSPECDVGGLEFHNFLRGTAA
jgi:hypothetical protein